MIGQLHQGDSGAHASEGLGEFAAQGASPEHQQALGERLKIENIFIGQVAGFREAGNRGHRRPGAGGNHRRAKRKPLAAHFDMAAIDEAPRAEKDIHAHFFAEACCGIVGCDAGADGAHSLHHRWEVQGGFAL